MLYNVNVGTVWFVDVQNNPVNLDCNNLSFIKIKHNPRSTNQFSSSCWISAE